MGKRLIVIGFIWKEAYGHFWSSSGTSGGEREITFGESPKSRGELERLTADSTAWLTGVQFTTALAISGQRKGANDMGAISVESYGAQEQLQQRKSRPGIRQRDFDLFGKPGENRRINLVGPVGGRDQEDGLRIA